MKVFLLVSLVGLTYSYQVKDGPLLNYRPSWLKSCKRSDPEMNACLNELFSEMFPQLAKGIAELNIDPFEPLFLDEVSVTKGSGAVTLTGSFHNLTVVGPSNSTPSYTDLSLEKKQLNFGIYLPLLDIKAIYNLKGHILILPLVGHGDCELSLQGVDTKVKANISIHRKENRKVMLVDDMKLSFTLEKIKIHLDNLFNGNKVLGLTVNAFMNQHGLEIVSELEEPLSESLAQIFTDIINNIFRKIPLDLWLPEEVASTEDEKVFDSLAKDISKS